LGFHQLSNQVDLRYEFNCIARFSHPCFIAAIALTGYGSIESAAKDDCISIGWQIGSKGYNDCFKARFY
jgi:hypothetical protein